MRSIKNRLLFEARQNWGSVLKTRASVMKQDYIKWYSASRRELANVRTANIVSVTYFANEHLWSLDFQTKPKQWAYLKRIATASFCRGSYFLFDKCLVPHYSGRSPRRVIIALVSCQTFMIQNRDVHRGQYRALDNQSQISPPCNWYHINKEFPNFRETSSSTLWQTLLSVEP